MTLHNFFITVHIFDVNFDGVMKVFNINYMKGQNASTAPVLFQSVNDVLARVMFSETTVLCRDSISLTQTLAIEIQLKPEL